MYQSFMWLCHIVFILNGKVVKTAQFTLKLLKRHVFGEYLLWQEAQIIETVLEFSLNLRSQQSPTLNWSIWSNTLRLVLHRLKDFQVYMYIVRKVWRKHPILIHLDRPFFTVLMRGLFNIHEYQEAGFRTWSDCK